MKISSILSLAAILAVSGTGFLTAQEETPTPVELPSGPLLKSAPDFSKWIVTYQYPKEILPDAPVRDGSEPVQVTVTKTGAIISEVTIDAKNRRSEIWHVGQVQYNSFADSSKWFESTAPRDSTPSTTGFNPLPANGFRGWDWVDASSYVGTIALKTVETLAFLPGGAGTLKQRSPDQIREQIGARPRVAYVNFETRFPLAMRNEGVVESFAFQPAPVQKQSLPAELQKAIQEGEEARRRLYKQAPRPY